MTDEKVVEYIRTHKKFPRDFYDYLNYSIFMAPFCFVVLGFIVLTFLKGPKDLFLGVLFILVGALTTILFAIKFTTARQFHSIKLRRDITLDKANDLIKNNFRINRLTIDRELGKIDASEPMTFFSYGSEITLLFENQTALINVRVGPFFQPFTLFRDKRNLKRVIKLLT